MENLGEKQARIYYQIDYSLENVSKNTPYFPRPVPAHESLA